MGGWLCTPFTCGNVTAAVGPVGRLPIIRASTTADAAAGTAVPFRTGTDQAVTRSLGISTISAHTGSMRAPKRRRPLRRTYAAPPSGVDLAELAGRVRYVGSSEHKTSPSFAGPPHPRADASKCDPKLTDAEVLTTWLRAAVAAGRIGAPWEGDFPRYAWGTIDGVHYEGRLVNRDQGSYKGYPLTILEWAAMSRAPAEDR